jgi:putative transposase
VIGLDLGISALLTTSDGDKVEHPYFYCNAQCRLRVLQRSLARKRRGGKNRRKALRRLQRQHAHIVSQRRDYAHKLTTALVREYDLIGVEHLRIPNMVRNKTLSKSILDSGWGIFRELLANKAVSAGRQVVFVDPAYTSRTCSGCGGLFEGLTLADRWVSCGCGLSLDRDHNAARNVLAKAMSTRRDATVQRNVDPLPSASAGGKVKRAVEATPRKRL